MIFKNGKTGEAEHTITIYTLNDDQYEDTGYDVPEHPESRELCRSLEDDFIEFAPEIAKEMLSQFKGQMEHKVKVIIEYYKYNTPDGVEYDCDYSYEILESKETDWFEREEDKGEEDER